MTGMLKMALERVGFTVDAFNDPVLAFESFKPNQYDLVILDVMMQKMNGFELCDRLQKVDSDIKVCFLTASSETYWKTFIKENQCEIDRDLFLEMPLPLKEIIAKINKRIGLP